MESLTRYYSLMSLWKYYKLFIGVIKRICHDMELVANFMSNFLKSRFRQTIHSPVKTRRPLLNYKSSVTSSRSSRICMGRPLPLGNVMAGSIPMAL